MKYLFTFLALALPLCAQDQKSPQVLMKTSMGDITIELDQEKAPLSVKNFLSYVDSKHYDGTVFHRIIDNFMIQGGGFTANDGKLTKKKTQAPIKNEASNGLKNSQYTIAMARTQVYDSATSQFFINDKDNAFLDFRGGQTGYAVFGKVIKGQKIVDAISQVKTGQGKLDGRNAPNIPLKEVTIHSITLIPDSKKEEMKKEAPPTKDKEAPAK